MSLLKVKWRLTSNPMVSGEVIRPTPVWIGRGEQNSLVLSDPGGGVSQRHAVIRTARRNAERTLVLKDIESANGTWLNGRRVSLTEVLPGTPIVIGIYVLNIYKQTRCQKGSCRRPFDNSETICPWCGQFMTDAHTAEIVGSIPIPVAH